MTEIIIQKKGWMLLDIYYLECFDNFILNI